MRMQSLRLAVSAGKLDVCKLACIYGVEEPNHQTPRRGSRLGGHWELVWKPVPTGPTGRQNHETTRRKTRAFLELGGSL